MEILAKIITALLIGGLGFLFVYEIIKLVQDFKKRKQKKLDAQKVVAENKDDRKDLK